MDCYWYFSSDAKLQLAFVSFNTESCCDRVSVYDGDSTSSPLIGQFSGSSLPTPITSSSNELYVRFTTDGSVVNSGFVASYQGIFFKCHLLNGPFNFFFMWMFNAIDNFLMFL